MLLNTKITPITITAFCLSALLLGVPAHATNVTFPDCLRIASENSHTLRTAREKLFQAETSELASYSSFYPQLSLSAGKNNSSQTINDHTTDPVNSYSYGLSAKQLLFDGFKTWALKDSAKAELKAAAFDHAVSEANVRYSVRKAFISLLNAQEQLTLTRTIRDRRKQNLDMIALRYEAGREHRGALLVAQADLAAAEAEVSQSIRAIALGLQQLKTECGVPTMDITGVTEQATLKTAQEESPDIETIASTNPTLQALIIRIDSARNNVAAANAAYYPDLSASYQTGRSGGDWDENDSSTDWGSNWSFGLNLSFMLFDGNATTASTYKARSQLRQAQAQALDGKGTITYTLAQTWNELANARDTVIVRTKYLEAAEERASIAAAQYSTGLIGFDDWSTIEDSLVSARKGMLNARTALLTAEANWIQAQGGGLSYEQ